MLLTSQSYKYVFLIWLTAAASGVFKSASLKIALRSLSCVPKKNLSITVLKECLHKSFNLLNWNLNYKLPNSLVRTKSAIRQKELYLLQAKLLKRCLTQRCLVLVLLLLQVSLDTFTLRQEGDIFDALYFDENNSLHFSVMVNKLRRLMEKTFLTARWKLVLSLLRMSRMRRLGMMTRLK